MKYKLQFYQRTPGKKYNKSQSADCMFVLLLFIFEADELLWRCRQIQYFALILIAYDIS